MVTAPEREEAFRLIFQANYRAVLAYARRRTSGDDADDVLAETFLVAWRRLGDVPRGRQTLPWLYGVARRVLADQHRRSGRRQRLFTRLASMPAEAPGLGWPPDPGETEVVEAALARLRPAEREILRLSTWEELSNPEIAEVVGCSTNAAAIRLHRARRRFGNALAALEANAGLGSRGGGR